MTDSKQQLQIIIDQATVRFMVGFGYDGKIDRRLGRPRQFKDLLKAADFAEWLAQAHNIIAQRYSPNDDRKIKVHRTPAFWAQVEAIKARLDDQSAEEVRHDE